MVVSMLAARRGQCLAWDGRHVAMTRGEAHGTSNNLKCNSMEVANR